MNTSSEQWEQDAAAIRAAHPRHILFLCIGNSSRSQLAEGIARSLAPAGTKISSAGSIPTRVNPLALRVHWPLSDPSLGDDGDSVPLDTYRRVRDELRRRLTEVFKPGDGR
jgi:arsenate reductase